ncbi:YbhB/YbcL family Raf kinase inhibitor-like protein [Geomonas sp. RF6]|uniref:YbhB/YbcL family Raf kinase inhibitor-like protein n=1 Tax=Geomonas sp. RF6 TaxID=2897342 RepID=UPI001E4A37D6|nr:YbhB/YbcL family Raf kinase inhibitor-like protein [Geomonas sp. RF6]UFS68780.1 YbhB/YbcL family Raf kinase inhibitor-like protein [Geomonas sp. RF6]
MEFKLSSPAFNNGTQIPSRYTCDGENINPHLVIHGVPAKTKSLALLVEDPDAPAGLWVHWVMWNMPPDTTEIREHTVPFGAKEGLNTRRKHGYDGPCPPSGSHRYFFRLFALDQKLELKADAGKEQLEEAMMTHILATTELMGTYSRTNEGPM